MRGNAIACIPAVSFARCDFVHHSLKAFEVMQARLNECCPGSCPEVPTQCVTATGELMCGPGEYIKETKCVLCGDGATVASPPTDCGELGRANMR